MRYIGQLGFLFAMLVACSILAGREVHIIRKWGSWQDWLHDCAVVTGPQRHSILVALTKHPRGDEYLEDLARAVDDLMLADSAK